MPDRPTRLRIKEAHDVAGDLLQLGAGAGPLQQQPVIARTLQARRRLQGGSHR